jgi:hypothetical protein
MKRAKFSLAVVLCIMTITSVAQIRVSKLLIKKGEVYSIEQSDILVADTLIMMDSSKILLNRLKKENYIRAQVAYFGTGSTIEGVGLKGSNGRKGIDGDTPFGPCKNGEPGKDGVKGLDGGSGVNLYLYFDKVTIQDKLIINLQGGKGGNGGAGGSGGAGSPGTVHCKGGDGGKGGNGAPGGNGGVGGILSVSCTKCEDLRALVAKSVILQNNGGYFGSGGTGGYGELSGSSPSKSGKSGGHGLDGPRGKAGEKGGISFVIN